VPRGRRFGALLLAVGLGLVMPSGTGAAYQDTVAAEQGASLASPAQSVTFITGDRVTVRVIDGRQVPRIEPGPGREEMRFSVRHVDGRLIVLPEDVVPLLNAGRLDLRLFDVTTLLRFGYDDASRSDLPLIVRQSSGTSISPLTTAGAQITRQLSVIGSVALRQPKGNATRLWEALTGGSASDAMSVEHVWLDGLRQLTLDVSVPQIGAPTAWETGYTGEGVTVAILDTGVDATHPDLAGRVVEAANFTEASDASDTVGHGTHVASIVAGSGAASDGAYRGVAPDAQLISGKICQTNQCVESAILAGMQWAAESGADIVNLSLGGPDTAEVDPLEEAVNRLTAEYGTLFVIAAGNDGFFGDHTVDSPATADAALAVGAVDDDGQLARFSSQGPRIGDEAVKPDITAPGVGIVAARASGTQMGTPVGEYYTAADGTSMAAPHVTGAAALLAQQHPEWGPVELKAVLMGSATPNPQLGVFQQGAGRVNVAAALEQRVYAEPAALSAGIQLWPHSDDEPVTQTLTYHNLTDEAVILSLEIVDARTGETAAPEGMFVVSDSSVEVPAGGSASVEVTVDTRGDGPDGWYSATIVATGDGNTVFTPIGVNKEVESYTLTVTHLDRNGELASNYNTLVSGVDSSAFLFPYDPDGEFSIRLPRGTYHLDTNIYTFYGTGQIPELSNLVNPLVELTRDTTVRLDARSARPITVEFEHVGVRLGLISVSYLRYTDVGGLTSSLFASSLDGVYAGHTGVSLESDELIAEIAGLWGVPGSDGTLYTSQRVYHLAWHQYGRVFTGFSRQVTDDGLAVVEATYHTAGPDRIGTKYWYSGPVRHGVLLGLGADFALPTTRTELHNVEGVIWQAEFTQLDVNAAGEAQIEVELWSPEPVEHEPDQTYRETWNTAPFGPGFPGDTLYAVRTDDEIRVSIPLFSDASGHAGASAVVERARTALYSGERLIGESTEPGEGAFTVPGGEAEYRLVAEAVREQTFTTQVSAEWRFTAAGGGDEPRALPLLAVVFSPQLDAHNQAPAQGAYQIPVRIDSQGAAVDAAELVVEASFDDGESWQELTLTEESAGRYLADITHPATEGFVSLRATATDATGNAVEQTIIRAYRIIEG